jgi:type I restriction enzyme S subunit
MTDGLKPEHRQAIIETLAANPKVERIVLFGSRATGTFTLTSDVDLALFGDDLTLSDQAALAEAVAELSVPQRVDLLIFHRIANQALREEIRKHGVEWFARGGTARTAHIAGEWRMEKFGRMAQLVRDTVHPSEAVGLPYIGLEHIGESSLSLVRLGTAEDATSLKSRFRRGDILFGRLRPYFRKVVRAPLDGICSTDIWVVRPRIGVDAGFLFYLMASDLFIEPVVRASEGTKMPRAQWEYAASLEQPLPPLPEQRAIAHILGTLDDKIELNRRMSQTLEAMARALFKAWFVDFEPVRAKLEGRWQSGQSLPGLPAHLYHLFPDRLVDSELGQIPEGWEVKAINDLAEVVGGSTPRTERAEYWEGGTYHWVTPKDLSGLSLPVLLDTERKITDAGLAQISSGLLPKGTVLLSSRAPIGYLAIAEVPVAINQGFIAIKPRFGVSNLFLLRWAGAFHDEIVSRANGSTFLEISKSNFRQIRIVAPSSSVMDAFDRLSRSMYYKVVENERESRALAGLRDALLPKLIRGEMRVKDAERFLKERGL